MKKLLIITTLLSLITLQLSFAHGGRTDKDGCHKGKDGIRHCHKKSEKPSKKD